MPAQSSSANDGSATRTDVGQEDLTLLANLTEKDINNNLKTRFNHDIIYTNIGNVLLSVNPYKPIPFLYDNELIEFYKLGGKERSVSNVLALQRKMREKILLLLEANSGRAGGISAIHQRFSNTRAGAGNSGSSVVTAILQNKALLTGLTSNHSHALTQAFPYLSGGPHVFQLANSMYHALVTEEENQTVIISGESGAGKTEASKQIINFISYISDKQRTGSEAIPDGERQSVTERADGAHGSGEEDTIEKIKCIILESNPLMEAFGNAKTVKNDNSSRFGKFFEVYFPKNDSGYTPGSHPAKHSSYQSAFYGLPVGGHMSIFLLEKSRVVQQQFGERNFHIFYQLIAGLDTETKSRLRLDIFEHPARTRSHGRGDGKFCFNYLNSGRTTTIDRVDDSAEFAKTRHAMHVVGISESVQVFIFEVLAVILHLGELEFVDEANRQSGDDDDDDGAPAGRSRVAAVAGSGVCKIRNQETLQFVASLLKLDDPAALEKALTVKVLEVGERREGYTGGSNPGGGAKKNVQVLEVPLDLAECRNNRDAVAKLLYDSVFNFIVYFINNALTTASKFTAQQKDDKARGKGHDKASETDAGEDDVLFQHFAENMRQENLQEVQEANAEKFLMLGVLDIYGFEIFANNSFEQFCINYINEKLHQIFIDLTLAKEQEEYENENIILPQKIDNYFDNKRILNVIEGTTGGGGDTDSAGGKPSAAAIPGIFQLLDDICVSLAKEPEQVADAKFLEKLDMFLSTSPAAAPYFQKSEKNGFFTVRHYAGNVTYNVNGFVTKNKDKLSNTVLEELRKTGHIFVAEILAPIMFLLDEEEEENARQRAFGTGGGAKKKNIFLSSGRKIRQQADQLVSKLRSSNIHYIRTIKPNEEKKSDLFMDESVLHQIQYLGLMENVQIRKMGFIYRNYFDVFLRRFYIIFSLMNERVKRQQYSPYTTTNAITSRGRPGNNAGLGYVEPYNFLEHDDKESCEVLLTFVESEVARLHNQAPQTAAPQRERGGGVGGGAELRMGFERGCWQLGKTKVFIRQPAHLSTLERLREACVEAKARKIQRCYRDYRSEKANIMLKQRMTRLYTKNDKARRADSVFRAYSGDYLDIKGSSLYFAHNAVRNHRDLLRILRYDPLAVGWRELFSERDGKFYYVNLFTNESQWAKPPAMAEMELYGDNNAAEEAGDTGVGEYGATAAALPEPVNVEGVRVVFSAKVDRVAISLPFLFGAMGASRVPQQQDNQRPEDSSATPQCRTQEHLLVITNKALFLFEEKTETLTTYKAVSSPPDEHPKHTRRHKKASRGGEPEALPKQQVEVETTVTSRLVLVKRVDLRLLRGITVSPYADEYIYIHVYPQLEPYRPIFLSERAHNRGLTDEPGEALKDPGRTAKKKKSKRDGASSAAQQPVVLCDCCGRRLPPAAPRAHCPCCGRLCCLRTCLCDASHGVRHRLRPLPTLLGSNVVNPVGLAAVARAKEAALAEVAAAMAAHAKQQQRQSKDSRRKHGNGAAGAQTAVTTTESDPVTTGGDNWANHVVTADEARLVESVLVCPWCVNLEPLEMNEDIILKTFLRTELAAFLLKEYKHQMGFALPFRVAGAGGPPIHISLSVNRQLEHDVLKAAAAAGGGGERKLLAALATGKVSSGKEHPPSSSSNRRGRQKKTKGEATASASPQPEILFPFSSYRTFAVQCTAREDGTQDEGSYMSIQWSAFAPALENSVNGGINASGYSGEDGPSPFFGSVTLNASAPPGLAKSIIATVEAKREERRRVFEQKRRDEAAAIRAKAEAKAIEREENYARLVEEKKRERREKAAQERNARLWKEEEQRKRREAAALVVSQKAKRGP